MSLPAGSTEPPKHPASTSPATGLPRSHPPHTQGEGPPLSEGSGLGLEEGVTGPPGIFFPLQSRNNGSYRKVVSRDQRVACATYWDLLGCISESRAADSHGDADLDKAGPPSPAPLAPQSGDREEGGEERSLLAKALTGTCRPSWLHLRGMGVPVLTPLGSFPFPTLVTPRGF